MSARSARALLPLAPLLLAIFAACGSSDAGSDGAGPDASVPDGRRGDDTSSGDDSAPADDDGNAPGDDTGDDGGASGDDANPTPPGSPCGYKDQGRTLQVTSDIEICLPPVVCTPSETCPRGLGDCVNGKCVFKPGYLGIATLPEAWTTYYCDLKTGGCNGAVLDPQPYDVAKALSAKHGPVCADAPGTSGTCVGVAAPPPMMAGNSQVAIDPSTGKTVALWGLGMTPATGDCYELTGDGGTAVVAITDRCAGYCKCRGGDFNECGNCINAPDTTTECACVGTAPPVYNACCGRTCGAAQQCDWCANNNHPHFDLDTATFNHVCGPSGQTFGSCKLSKVRLIRGCYPAKPNWPN